MPLDVQSLTPLLQVYDMPTSIHFYRDQLGFEIVNTSPNLGAPDKVHWAMLRLGQSLLMLNTAYEFDDERPTPPDPARIAAHNDTGLYFGCSNLEASFLELTAKGVPITAPKTTPYGMREISIKDPDGYSLFLNAPA